MFTLETPLEAMKQILMFESRCLTMVESVLVLLLCWDMGGCHEQRISVRLIWSTAAVNWSLIMVHTTSILEEYHS